MKYLFSTTSEVDLKGLQSREHRTLLSVMLYAGLRLTRASCFGAAQIVAPTCLMLEHQTRLKHR
jgi:hypothetical protein